MVSGAGAGVIDEEELEVEDDKADKAEGGVAAAAAGGCGIRP